MNSRVLIIAEAGVNHNGSLELAKRLVDVAKESGADFVKFQTFKTELSISRTAKKADYQIENTMDNEESQFDMIKRLELSFDDFKELFNYSKYKEIGFLSTGFDIPSIEFLNNVGQPFFKIPSGEITNKPFLQHIARKGKPVIISTGMANMDEIRDALKVLIDEGLGIEKIIVLHCNTGYPTPMEDVNLRAMNFIKDSLGVKVGYSDHTLGIEVPVAAVALGAEVIEKHFTLDRTLPGPDHKASLEPNELKNMILSIRNIELALGNEVKNASPSEQKNILIARKSVHLTRSVKKGEIVMESDLIMKRPGDGISPMKISNVLGKKYKNDLKEDYKLSFSDLD